MQAGNVSWKHRIAFLSYTHIPHPWEWISVSPPLRQNPLKLNEKSVGAAQFIPNNWHMILKFWWWLMDFVPFFRFSRTKKKGYDLSLSMYGNIDIERKDIWLCCCVPISYVDVTVIQIEWWCVYANGLFVLFVVQRVWKMFLTSTPYPLRYE